MHRQLLTLRREALAELAVADLAAVAGASAGCPTHDPVCLVRDITDDSIRPPTFDCVRP